MKGVAFSLTPWQLDGRDPERERLRDAFPDADGPLGLLYALGVDAWRLAHWQRHAPPGLPFLGLTGQLTQAKDQRWVRTLRLATIERGALSPTPARFAVPAASTVTRPLSQPDTMTPEGPGRRAGRAGEARAAAFLAARGYQLRDRNWHCRYGEWDLILAAPGDRLWAFVEVRYRRRPLGDTPQPP